MQGPMPEVLSSGIPLRLHSLKSPDFNGQECLRDDTAGNRSLLLALVNKQEAAAEVLLTPIGKVNAIDALSTHRVRDRGDRIQSTTNPSRTGVVEAADDGSF